MKKVDVTSTGESVFKSRTKVNKHCELERLSFSGIIPALSLCSAPEVSGLNINTGAVRARLGLMKSQRCCARCRERAYDSQSASVVVVHADGSALMIPNAYERAYDSQTGPPIPEDRS